MERQSRRVILSLFTLNLLWLHALHSQRSNGSFGPVAEQALGFAPTGLAISKSPGSTRADAAVLSLSPPAIHLYSLRDSGLIVQTTEIRLSGPREGLICADPGRGDPAFVALSPDGTTISVIRRTANRYQESSFATGCKAGRVAVSDINNDGVRDLLLYGKGMTGITTWLGRRGGGYTSGPELFADVSISDLKTADVNGDGILDVMVCSWLSNQLMIFYGINSLVFSEQVTVNLPGEPDAVSFTWFNRRKWLGIAVALPEEHKLALLRGTPSGDIQIDEMMSVPATPSGVEFANVNDDGFPDLIVPTDLGIVVSLGTEKYGYLPPMIFGPGAGCAGWGMGDMDGDRRIDLVAAEKQSRRLVILGNAQHDNRVRWPSVYAVGSSPYGLTLEDLNGDGLVDIAVANARSSTLSILLNRGKGHFFGQQSLSVAEQPRHVTASVATGSRNIALISSHPTAERIGVVSWSDDPAHASSFAIPTGTQPYVLYAWQDTTLLNVLVRYEPRGSTHVSLSLFEQMSGRQFLERSLRVSLPDRLSAVTVDRRSDASTYRVAYVSRDNISRVSSLSVGVANSSFALGEVRQVLSFSDTTGATRGVIPASLASAGSRDLILVLGKPVNALGLAYRTATGEFRDSLEWIRNVSIDDDDDVIVRDVNADNFPDLTIRNDATERVETLYGGPGGFGQRITICSARGVKAIGIASLASPPIQDLVLSRSSDGTVSILFAPFRH